VNINWFSKWHTRDLSGKVNLDTKKAKNKVV